jgi:hypothetical protein
MSVIFTLTDPKTVRDEDALYQHSLQKRHIPAHNDLPNQLQEGVTIACCA